ncbi:MAG: hypothetical protein EBU49_15105 [Proteobacteria bacterium]|nr:hypothetical protein [Pseudomonadota bacterium]
MRPLLFHFLGLPVPAWHFFFAAAALAAFFSFRSAICKSHGGISAKSLSVIFSASYFGVISGAMAWSILIEGAGAHPAGLPSHFAMSSSGGIIGGAICASVAARFFRIPMAIVGDAAANAVVLALAIGRIGCFLNGDDYGLAVSPNMRWLGVVFPNLHDGGVLRHPVQLYESAGCLAGIFLSWILRSKAVLRGARLDVGVIGSLTLIWYATLRFLLEGLRDDWRGLPAHFSETLLFSPPQVVAIAMFLLGILFLSRLKVNE